MREQEEKTKMERNKEDLLREEENTQKSDEKKKKIPTVHFFPNRWHYIFTLNFHNKYKSRN